MEYKLIKSGKGIWIFIDNRHKKTIPKQFEKDFEKLKDKLSFDKKRLTVAEREMFHNLTFSNFVENYLKAIESTDKHLFRMLEKATPVATRFVNSKNGNRYELKFDNGIFVKVPKQLHTASHSKLNDAFLNY